MCLWHEASDGALARVLWFVAVVIKKLRLDDKISCVGGQRAYIRGVPTTEQSGAAEVSPSARRFLLSGARIREVRGTTGVNALRG